MVPYFLGKIGPETFQHEVQNDDLVLLATDGVLDNIFPEHMLKMIEEQSQEKLQSAKELTQLADTIAQTAFTLSQDSEFLSPFYINARKDADPKVQEKYKDKTGGKIGDITIIVGKVNLRKKGWSFFK